MCLSESVLGLLVLVVGELEVVNHHLGGGDVFLCFFVDSVDCFCDKGLPEGQSLWTFVKDMFMCFFHITFGTVVVAVHNFLVVTIR